MKTKNYRFRVAGFYLPVLFLVLVGCQTTNYPSPVATVKSPQEIVKAPELPLPPAGAGDQPSTLSYGMVTGRVKKGVTTQQELIDLFGGPSTMTTDKDGTEVWMYDKTASTVTGSYAQSGSQASRSDARIEANTMATFFGIPLVAGVGSTTGSANASATAQSAQVGQGSGTVTRSVKTITFIIKFNADKTVKDYAVRHASY